MVTRAVFTIRRRGKVIARAEASGDAGDPGYIRRAAEEAGRQAKAHDVAIKSPRQAYRRKRKDDNI